MSIGPEFCTPDHKEFAEHCASIWGPPRILAIRDLVRSHVECVVVNPKQIDITLNTNISAKFEDQIGIRKGKDFQASGPSLAGPAILQVTWRPETFRAEKGIVSMPTSVPSLEPEIRDSLLIAIAKARSWMDNLIEGRIQSIKETAQREKKGERYIRRLAALAFLSPRIVNAIAEGTAPADLSVTSLTRDLPISWKMQEDRIGMQRGWGPSGAYRRPPQGHVNPAIHIRRQMSGVF